MTVDYTLQVFVHLALNKDAPDWRAAHMAGKLVGINDETPYGYGRADDMGCAVTFSRKGRYNPITKIMRLGLRAVLGFDLVHAWHQRHAMKNSDIIWTHTESQFLGAAAVLLLTRADTKLLGQTVWLIDKWPNLGRVRRWFYRKLIQRVSVMTFLSPLNLSKSKEYFPDMDSRIVPFGIPSETTIEPRLFPGGPIRVLAVGNDVHRDWQTLVDAVGHAPDIKLEILSGTAPAQLAKSRSNITICSAKTNPEMQEALSRADIVCVPLKSNLHASGITALQEAVLYGVPVVATDVGGLDYYFPREEISYVPEGDTVAIRKAIRAIAEEPEEARARAVAAQARMKDRETPGAQAYVARHVEISLELLGRKALGQLSNPVEGRRMPSAAMSPAV